MAKITLTLQLLLLSLLTKAQNQPLWVKYSEMQGKFWGYKDLSGVTKIPAQYAHFPIADTFHNIIAVSDTAWKMFYLLKTGEKIGTDSVYMWDYAFDCEREGKIRFQDKSSRKTGFFDSTGKVIVPAMYDNATPFCNGMAVVLKGATKVCDDDGCEHWHWQGGTTAVINSQNTELIQNWNDTIGDINWYSVEINTPPLDTQIRIEIIAADGNNYSFVHYEKEFERWFHTVFLPATLKGNTAEISNLLFPLITYWSDKKREWISQTRNVFLRKHFKNVATSLKTCSKRNTEIFHEQLNNFIFTNSRYLKYRNPCGEHDDYKFPLFDAVKSYFDVDGKIIRQDQFQFIRTEDGYKMHSVSLK